MLASGLHAACLSAGAARPRLRWRLSRTTTHMYFFYHARLHLVSDLNSDMEVSMRFVFLTVLVGTKEIHVLC